LGYPAKTDRRGSLTIGGAVAASIHGRCLTASPFISDIESLEVVTAEGNVIYCSRTVQSELFRHVVGGYGLFGVVTAAELRLTPRQRVQRRVEMLDIDGLVETLEARIAAGALYGDFQFAIDPTTPQFMRTGILSCYHPAGSVTQTRGGTFCAIPWTSSTAPCASSSRIMRAHCRGRGIGMPV